MARTLFGTSPDLSSYAVVKVAPGHEIEEVRKALTTRLAPSPPGQAPDAEILTHNEFRKRSLNRWLFETGAGAALITGAALGLIVGVVIVAQTLYSSTKDHLNEFATLRALGASAGYIIKVILMQAVLSAIIGYILGIMLSLVVIWASRNDPSLLIIMTPQSRGPAVRPDRRHVRVCGDLRDLQGDPHRSSRRLQPLGGNHGEQPMLEAKNIVKVLGEGAAQVQALKGVNLDLMPGELTLLMGPSGSGKTTLLSILGCILSPNSGTLTIARHTATGMSPEQLADLRRQHVGFVFQSYNLVPTLTATENIMLALDLRGRPAVGGPGACRQGAAPGGPVA